MKKIVICLLTAIMLMNCEVKVQSSQAQAQTKSEYDFIDQKVGNITYRIWSYTTNFDGSKSISVLNLTKDSLEVAYYRKQLNK